MKKNLKKLIANFLLIKFTLFTDKSSSKQKKIDKIVMKVTWQK